MFYAQPNELIGTCAIASWQHRKIAISSNSIILRKFHWTSHLLVLIVHSATAEDDEE